MRILVAEDEKSLNRIIAKQLKASGYSVDCAFNGEEAYDLISVTEYDAAVFDVMMPKIDGYEVVKEIRQYSKVPIIMLTAKDKEVDELMGFDLGVDEYISKTVSLKILVARVEAIIRRTNNMIDNEVLHAGGIEINLQGQVVKIDGEEIELTNKEFDLLHYFFVNQKVALSRETILNNVWNYDYFGDARTIDTHVKKLRSKLGEKGAYIRTIWGKGYKFEVE
jgi:DNA-binding response OmpR family regulator